MAYLVLARKYRPQSFADLTGQEHVVQTLSNALRTDRVAHALLFCGPRGCGKTTSARIVAKALNCEKGPTPNPCGECSPCREIAAGTDVDVQEIDAASNTGVDNVRELRESAKYLPARDRFKIFIVDEVHMLSKAAFNAFLKTLEEPPGHVKFLFATTDPQALPDTILSRCQRHNFRLVPLKQIVERIQQIAVSEGVKIEAGAVALVARQAAGSMRDALSILDQLFSSCGGSDAPITEQDAAQALGALDHAVVGELARSLIARDASGVLQSVARAYDGGHDLKRLAEDLATHLRNLIAVSVAGGPLDLPDHELKALQTQAAGVDGAELARLFELVHTALSEMSRAAQPRHALEIALLRAVHLAPADSVQGLLRRADDLLRRLGGDPGAPPSGGGGGGGARPAMRDSGSGGGTSRWTAPTARGATASALAPATTVAVAVATPAPAAQSTPAPVAEATPAQVAQAAPAPVPEAAPAMRPTPPPAPAGSPWARHLSLVPDVSPPPPEAAPVPAPPSPPIEAPRVEAPSVASTPSEPPAVVEVAVDSALKQRWPSAVAQVKVTKPLLGSFLEHALPLSLADGVLRLGFARGSSYARSIDEDRQTLAALLSTEFGSTVRVEVVEVAQTTGMGVATLADEHDRAQQQAREARLTMGREHPSIGRAVAMLGAEIEDVRDLGGE